jgi:GH15 family glucan-1,4-alpha-glucosidase
LNLFVGRDRESGAIVASPSRQPAYHFDWPRDGSFYDLSLDLAGFNDIAGSHLEFYRRTQRTEERDSSFLWLLGGKSPSYSPKGHWYSNIYTDGSPGKLKLIPLEIDETALLLWDLWRHEQFVPVADRSRYQKENLQMLELGADALLEYVDVDKGWTKKVFEDDNYIPGATLHGAAAVLAGLAGAVDAGTRWGADPAQVAKWRQAAVSLRQGMLKKIADEKTLEAGGWRGVQWSLFPAPVFESYNDPLAEKLIKRLADQVEAEAGKQRPGFAYLGEKVFILAIATAKKPEYKPLVQKALDILVNQVPMPGTDCYGEVTLWITLPGDSTPVAQQRTSIPHLWTGVTTYLSVESYYRPERFASMVPPIPK